MARALEFCFLKIDVEGFEDEVIARQLENPDLSCLPQAILIETVLKRKWSTDFLAGLAAPGYPLAYEGEGNVLYRLGQSMG